MGMTSYNNAIICERRALLNHLFIINDMDNKLEYLENVDLFFSIRVPGFTLHKS